MPVFEVREDESALIYLNTKNYIDKHGTNNQIILTKNAGGREAINKRNRNLRNSRLTSAFYPVLERDEFPYASAVEGDKHDGYANVSFVPKLDNSIQGSQLSQFYFRYNITAGSKFIVKLIPSQHKDKEPVTIPFPVLVNPFYRRIPWDLLRRIIITSPKLFRPGILMPIIIPPGLFPENEGPIAKE